MTRSVGLLGLAGTMTRPPDLRRRAQRHAATMPMSDSDARTTQKTTVATISPNDRWLSRWTISGLDVPAGWAGTRTSRGGAVVAVAAGAAVAFGGCLAAAFVVAAAA